MSTGIQCPVCGSTKFRTVETRKGPNSVVRRKQCVAGHSFITTECVQGLPRGNAKLSPDKSAKLDALLAEGNKHAYIAAVLSINLKTVYLRAKRNKELSK
jgi:transcriptional regulator NrdR family protein